MHLITRLPMNVVHEYAIVSFSSVRAQVRCNPTLPVYLLSCPNLFLFLAHLKRSLRSTNPHCKGIQVHFVGRHMVFVLLLDAIRATVGGYLG